METSALAGTGQCEQPNWYALFCNFLRIIIMFLLYSSTTISFPAAKCVGNVNAGASVVKLYML